MFEAGSQIAEHLLHFKTNSEEVMNWLGQTFDMDVRHGSDNVQPDLTVTIRDAYGKPFESFDVQISATGDRVVFDRVDYKLKVDKAYRTAELHVYDMFALKHALMNLYRGFFVLNKWGLLIHSSCVIEGGNAYIFSGRSGAGKSTIARLSHPRPLLSDEATIVKVTGDEVTVYDSPFRSDTQPEFIRQGVPLAAVHLIHQSRHVSRERTEGTHGVVQLMDKVFYWAYDKDQTKAILRMYEQLAQKVPIYDLHFQKNNTFWEAIS